MDTHICSLTHIIYTTDVNMCTHAYSTYTNMQICMHSCVCTHMYTCKLICTYVPAHFLEPQCMHLQNWIFSIVPLLSLLCGLRGHGTPVCTCLLQGAVNLVSRFVSSPSLAARKPRKTVPKTSRRVVFLVVEFFCLALFGVLFIYF